jgi:hypothetical protein
MIRSFLTRKPAPAPALIPYAMFDPERARVEANSARKLEGVYHKGQEKIWDGRRLLEELVERHGGVQIDAAQLRPLARIFAVIFWGELAAWKVAAALALELEPLEVKLAATAQAHDEARHFYVMHDYLSLLGYTPEPLTPSATRVLEEVVGANNLAKKLLGMHLMVEPIALTLFQVVRQRKLEPVLCDLLKFYERDEARHVALGVHYLPTLMKQMSPAEVADMWAWQLRMFMIQLDGLKEMESDIRALGMHPREVMRLGQAKQLKAAELMNLEMGIENPWLTSFFERVTESRLELDFPEDGASLRRRDRYRRAALALVRGPAERVDGSLEQAA